MANEIVTLTMSPCLDISAEVDALEPGAKMRCRNVRREPGGGGINVSRAITILGGRVASIFPAGGGSGKRIAESLKRLGIDTRPIFIDRLTRENFSIRERTSGNEYRFVMPGPELEQWQLCLETVTTLEPPPRYLVASGSLPPGTPEDFYARLAHHFASHPTRLVLDTSGAPLDLALKAKNIYLAKPNRHELEQLCGCSLDEEKDQASFCRSLVKGGQCEVLVLTLGAGGALLTSAEGQLRVKGLDLDVISSVGAGDSFVGAMILALERGWKLSEAFLYGMAAGSAALLTPGTELCRKEDTERLLQQLKEKNGARRERE